MVPCLLEVSMSLSQRNEKAFKFVVWFIGFSLGFAIVTLISIYFGLPKTDAQKLLTFFILIFSVAGVAFGLIEVWSEGMLKETRIEKSILVPDSVLIRFSKDQKERLVEIIQKVGFLDIKHIFNEAMTLYSWAVSVKESGRSVASIDLENHSYRELDMATLNKIKPKNKE